MQLFFKIVITILITGLIGCDTTDPNQIDRHSATEALKIAGLEFTSTEIDSLLEDLADSREKYQNMRKEEIPNAIPPALVFNPIPVGFKMPAENSEFIMLPADNVELPANRTDLAFYSVKDLGSLIRQKKISSVELTRFFIDRLKKYDQKLHCVITLTEDLALEEARQADAELAAGKYRGPLHGIPYGAKDLLAKKGYKTTWGAMPYKDQVIDEDATVIKKLRDAGAVLVAKLTLGALAWGDVWYGEKTRNPWNLEQGSSGSSAGSAAATAAGLGTCWIAAFDPAAAKEVLRLPEGVEPIAFTPLGYAAEPPPSKKRKLISELVTYERW